MNACFMWQCGTWLKIFASQCTQELSPIKNSKSPTCLLFKSEISEQQDGMVCNLLEDIPFHHGLRFRRLRTFSHNIGKDWSTIESNLFHIFISPLPICKYSLDIGLASGLCFLLLSLRLRNHIRQNWLSLVWGLYNFETKDLPQISVPLLSL